MSLPALPLDERSRVDLRVRTRGRSPARVVADARAQGLDAIALADPEDTSALVATIVEGVRRGLYVIPAVEVATADGALLGYFVDPQDPALARLVADGAGRSRSWAASASVLRGAGALVVGKGELPRRGDGRALAALLARAPRHGMQRSWRQRMRWRAENLTCEELEASLTPTPVELTGDGTSLLLRAPPGARVERPGLPFTVVGPGATRRLPHVLRTLREAGVTVVDERPYDDYPALAWDLYGAARDPLERRRRTRLRFELDRALYGSDADRCVVVYFETDATDLRPLKVRLRRSLGPMRFYRASAGDLVETCFESHLHMPDPDRVDVECALLDAHGLGARVSAGGPPTPPGRAGDRPRTPRRA